MAGSVNRGVELLEQGNQPSTAGLTEKAQQVASDVASQAGQAWDSTREGARQFASSVASTAETGWENVSQFFNRYGLPMFLVGIGLGFVLARAFANMSSDMTRRMSESSQYRY
jgi:hypothetical protein